MPGAEGDKKFVLFESLLLSPTLVNPRFYCYPPRGITANGLDLWKL